MPILPLPLSLTRILFPTLLISALAGAELRIANECVAVVVDQATSKLSLSDPGASAAFASGVLRATAATVVAGRIDDPVFGRGQILTIGYRDGSSDVAMVFPALPFALLRPTYANRGTAAIILNRCPVLSLDLALGHEVKDLTTFGTGGLIPPGDQPGSYAWMAVINPAGRDGLVAGWLTNERGSGVVAAAGGATVSVTARSEYGRLTIAPGATAVGETLAVGHFADARLGLEAWADAVAKRLAIKLPPQPVVYCTWYDNVHGGSGNAASIAELSAFAAKELKPYGFSCVQIDDGWQMGESKNGPNKNFSAFNANGPYKDGMKATADGLTALGLTAGLWLLPFGGTWNDPFFAEHQEWFVKRQDDGKPFDTAWGGTALDMTQPGARAFVAKEIALSVKDWGYSYLKLDGLSTGAGVQPQYVNTGWKEDNFGDAVFADPVKTNIDVYRAGLRLIRQTAGPKTFILGCCTPQNMRSYAGSFGLVDAMRTGSDNSASWNDWIGSSPLFGARHHHLHNRIWYNDPDPLYVRTSLPLESARCIASWHAIAGHMVSISDWLPGLPPERLDIIKRVIPSHGVTARAADLFQTQPQRIWTVSDERPDHQRRDVVGLFNWDAEDGDMRATVSGLGLPQAKRYVGFDFWSNTFVKPFTDALTLAVPGHGCRIVAVRPLLPRPFLLSTSRHVSQGILEVRQEAWHESTRTLTGTSAVVGGDAYELRLVAQSVDGAWAVDGVNLSATDRAAGATIAVEDHHGCVRVAIRSAASRDIAWTVRFRPAAPVAVAVPASPVGMRWKVGANHETINWTWNALDGVDVEVVRDDGKPVLSTANSIEQGGLKSGNSYRFRFTAVDWAGQRSPATEQTITMP